MSIVVKIYVDLYRCIIRSPPIYEESYWRCNVYLMRVNPLKIIKPEIEHKKFHRG